MPIELTTASPGVLSSIRALINSGESVLDTAQSYAEYDYEDIVPLSSSVVGYTDDYVGAPSLKPIRIQIQDIANLVDIPFKFTTNEFLSSSESIPQNVGYFDNEVSGDSHGNIILTLRRATNTVQNGQFNAIFNSGATNFINAIGCTSISTDVESISGYRNISVGSSWNTMDGEYNTIIGAASENNSVSGISLGIFNSVSNALDQDNDFTIVLGGGLNLARKTDLTSFVNTINCTVTGTLQCNILGGEGNKIHGTDTDLVSAVTLIGVYDRVVTPANSFYTITNNLSVLNDFSSNRIVLTSPNGSKFALSIDNSGTISSTPL